MRRFFLIAVPYAWLLALFLIPFVIVLKISLSDVELSIPPYTPTLDFSAGWQGIKDFFGALDFENFIWLTGDDLYWKAYLSSLKIAGIATALTLLVGYPMAYGMARAPESAENFKSGMPVRSPTTRIPGTLVRPCSSVSGNFSTVPAGQPVCSQRA